MLLTFGLLNDKKGDQLKVKEIVKTGQIKTHLAKLLASDSLNASVAK